MDATLLSHEVSGSHHAVAHRNSILELRSFAINPEPEYWASSVKRSRTIAENLPNHGSNDLKYSTIPLRAAIKVLTGGVDIRSALLARLAAATMMSRIEGIKLPC